MSDHQMTKRDLLRSVGAVQHRTAEMPEYWTLPNGRRVLLWAGNLYMGISTDMDLAQEELFRAANGHDLDRFAGIVECEAVTVVEVQRGVDGRVWVNVDGVCRLRARDADEVTVRDIRRLGPGHMAESEGLVQLEDVDVCPICGHPTNDGCTCGLSPKWSEATEEVDEDDIDDIEAPAGPSPATVRIEASDPDRPVYLVTGVRHGALVTEDITDSSRVMPEPAYVVTVDPDGSRRLDRVNRKGRLRLSWVPKGAPDSALIEAYRGDRLTHRSTGQG